jgi:hypothetical protein
MITTTSLGALESKRSRNKKILHAPWTDSGDFLALFRRAPPESPKPPEKPTINLALTWASQLGYRPKKIGDKAPDLPQEVWMVSPYVFVTSDSPGKVSVYFLLPVEIVSQDLAEVDRAKGPEHMGVVKTMLDSNPRSFNYTEPAEVFDLFDLKLVTIIQKVWISENDPSTFNRFADAIHEVENGGKTILEYIRTRKYVTPRPPETAVPDSKNAGSQMYR